MLDIIVKIVAYIGHEQIWHRIKWGKSKGRILWFTGLSGAGKTTIVEALKPELEKRGHQVVILDGDIIREIFPNTGFSKADRNAHIKRVGYTATLMASNGITVLCALISPYNESRKAVRDMAGDLFKLYYVSAPIEVCIKRDPKGLYQKVLKGEIKGFTGIDAPYEVPGDSDTILDDFITVDEAVKIVLKSVKN